jgi:hypothetical protein
MRSVDQQRRVKRSAIVLGLFAIGVYLAFIVYSIRSV